MRSAFFPLLIASFCLSGFPAPFNPEAALAALTLDEKIGQMIFVYYSPPRSLSRRTAPV